MGSSEEGESAPVADRPYHTKKPHKKSRSGCKNCKTRKVKCSEDRPSCRACTLRKEHCVYSSSKTRFNPGSKGLPSPAQTHSSAPSVVSDNPSSTILFEPLFRPMPSDATDMKLLWFFTISTFGSFSVEAGNNGPYDNAIKNQIPQHAFQHPFLMDCLLGLSALHLQQLGQDISASRAITYRARAFEGYRRAIEEANPETFPALIACSLLLCALSSQMFREQDAKPLYILDWMMVWRGIGLMIDLVTPDTLWASGMAVLFYRPVIDLQASASHIPNTLLFMVSSISPTDDDYEIKQDYYDTLKYLGTLYMELGAGFSPLLDLRIATFFTFLPKPFIQAAREERPRALVILSYWLAFARTVDKVWWMQGIGDKDIANICSHIGEEWFQFMLVPRAIMHLTDKHEMARLILNNHAWQPPAEDKYDPKNVGGNLNCLTWVDDEGEPVTLDGKWANRAVIRRVDGAAPKWNHARPNSSSSPESLSEDSPGRTTESSP